MNDKVSIIIPIYNGEKYISRCITSILEQKYNNIELILVNDGSTDKTKEICAHFVEKDNRIRLLNKENQGVSKARNSGLGIATGDFITFIDIDDYIVPGMISTALQYLKENNADVVIYGWKRNYVNKNQSEDILEEFEIIEEQQVVIRRILESYSACGGGYPWNKMWRRSAIKTMQMFDESLFYFEDLEWVVRMMLQVKRIVICPECLYQYIIHEGSVSTDSSRAEAKELSYHKALKKIIDNLEKHSDLQLWIQENYSPEIVNGVVHARRNNWWELEGYLKEQMLARKQIILKSPRIPLKTKIRCLRLLLRS